MSVSRRTVTVLFADVADSTQLGERLDAEALRDVMSRYFACVRGVLERHGGTIEKFIGDAVMAVFGVPDVHEDDALRAVRAATELRESLARLNDGLSSELNVRIGVRTGVNTGEVVTGDPTTGETLVTGDVVNTAQRLEAAAAPAEILIGEVTQRLVGGATLLEPADPIAAKGKAEPVRAWRVLAAIPGVPAISRRFDTPLVGRTEELARLEAAFDRAVSEHACHRFTLLASAGLGKSRLAAELFDRIGERAAVLVGRCLPYGDGITFWPLAEVLRAVGGDEAVATLLADSDDAEIVVERLRGISGRSHSGPTQETFWAVRKVCEALARRRPLVLCFEDLHWAEPTFLDLVEYLTGWVRDAPLLLLCLARPEFLEARPAWLSGDAHGSSLNLQALSPEESETMLAALDARAVDHARIVAAAEGNPLYVEQIAAMLAEGGDLTTIPPTIQALLAARLDRLPPPERATIERAAVAGKEFWRDAVVELTPEPERPDVGAQLLALVRKELIRPHRWGSRPDDAFRFGHVLIRDAAYASISKQARAVMHERFASWLEALAGASALEYEELLGYHLEQAFTYRAELSALDDSSRALGIGAAERLAAAGRRALTRSDIPAAINLLERSVSLFRRTERESPMVVLDLGVALRDGGDLVRADTVFSEAIEQAERAGDATQAERARIEHAALRLSVDPGFGPEEAEERAHSAIRTFEAGGDDLGLAKAWRLVADACWAQLRLAEMGDVLERALVHAERAEDEHEASEILRGLCRVALLGPMPVEQAVARCRDTLEAKGDDLGLQAAVQEILAVLLGMQGRFDDARDLLERARRSYRELGIGLRAGSMYTAFVELLAGEDADAERELRRASEELEAIGERAELSTTAALLALALCKLERLEEARHYADIAEASSSPGDIATQVILLRARSRITAGAGEHDRAEDMARAAVELAGTTDWLELRADALIDLAQLLDAAGRSDDAGECVRHAIDLYERKGIVASVTRVRAQLAQLVDA
jgi:class 3 adenylate cyclase/tetratricopeptide (TPR) repeat protein